MAIKRVLITGAGGVLGGAVCRRFSEQLDRYDLWGIDCRQSPRDDLLPEWRPLIPTDRLRRANIADIDAVRQAVAGMEVVIHLAATPNPFAPWNEILPNNIIGVYNIFEACRQANVQRVLFASSVRVSFGYFALEPYKAILEERFNDVPETIPLITHDMPTWAVEAYGASKVWGEALGRTYATQHGLSTLCLRIGGIARDGLPWTQKAMDLSVWCSFRDFVQLVQRCVEAPASIGFDIFYAVSNNRYRWVDIAHARHVVGYTPQDGIQVYRS